jgi:predicted PurR-regulated permease PerM
VSATSPGKQVVADETRRARSPAVSDIVRVVSVVVGAVVVLYLIYLLRKPIGWIVLAAFIATAVSGPIGLLSRRIPHGLAVLTVFLGVILVPVLILAVPIPPLVEQGNNLAQNAPRYANQVSDFVTTNPTLRGLNDDYDLTAKLQEQAAKLPARLGDVAGGLASVGAGVVSSVFAAVTILILSIFMVNGAPRWRRALMELQEPTRAVAINRLFDRTTVAVGGYVRGALLQALIAGVAAWIVLVILGVPYPLALALVVFVLDLVPLVGATLGAVIVGVVTLFANFPTTTIVWVIWAIVYQQVENSVIQPRIQSRAVNVEPFVVLVAVLFGSTLFGIFGALLAIPAAATIQIAVYEYAKFRRAGLTPTLGSPEPDDQQPHPAAQGKAEPATRPA